MLLRLAGAAGLLAAVVFGLAWNSAAETNRELETLAAGRDIGAERRALAPLAVWLAYAGLLARGGRHEDAQAVLADIAERGDGHLRVQALYNLANLTLRQSLDALAQGQDQRAAAFGASAKETYRRALRAEPGFWDAKYNLELATRLAPDFETVERTEGDEEPEGRRLWTQLPGTPRGLP